MIHSIYDISRMRITLHRRAQNISNRNFLREAAGNDRIFTAGYRRAGDRRGLRSAALRLDHHRRTGGAVRAEDRGIYRRAGRSVYVVGYGGAGDDAAYARNRRGRRGHRPGLHLHRDSRRRAPHRRRAGHGRLFARLLSHLAGAYRRTAERADKGGHSCGYRRRRVRL